MILQHVRKLANFQIGDILEAAVENGKITLNPKSLIDRHLAEGLEDAKKGRSHGPYASAKEAIAALDARAKRYAKKVINLRLTERTDKDYVGLPVALRKAFE